MRIYEILVLIISVALLAGTTANLVFGVPSLLNLVILISLVTAVLISVHLYKLSQEYKEVKHNLH